MKRIIEAIKSLFHSYKYELGYQEGYDEAYYADQQDTKYLEQQAYDAGRRDMLKFLCDELEHERIPIDLDDITGTQIAKRLKKHLAALASAKTEKKIKNDSEQTNR